MATRFSATAAAIGLAGGLLAASPAGAASAAAGPERLGPATPAAGPAWVRAQAAAVPAMTAMSATLTTSATAQHPATRSPAAEHPAPKKRRPKLPFHVTGKKARSLPDTGVPMSAALGSVTALTALLAGIGTVRAARRRPDREA